MGRARHYGSLNSRPYAITSNVLMAVGFLDADTPTDVQSAIVSGMGLWTAIVAGLVPRELKGGRMIIQYMGRKMG